MTKKILVIRNPVSASDKKAKLVFGVIERLKEKGCDVLLYETKAAGDAISYLLSLDERFDVVVAAGGDGTVNEVINGMANMPTTLLALIPAGTTNVLAKELGLKRSVKSLTEVIVNGLAKPVYLGRLNDRRFSMMVGVGYDAWVVNEVNLDVKKRFGKLAYVISMFRSLALFGKQKYFLDIDGRQAEACSIIITQGKYYAGSFVLSRKADLSNPSMQVLVMNTDSFLVFLLGVFALPLGMMENLPFVESIAAKEVRIKVTQSQPRYDVLQMDGDAAGTLPAHLKIEEEAVSILVDK